MTLDHKEIASKEREIQRAIESAYLDMYKRIFSDAGVDVPEDTKAFRDYFFSPYGVGDVNRALNGDHHAS